MNQEAYIPSIANNGVALTLKDWQDICDVSELDIPSDPTDMLCMIFGRQRPNYRDYGEWSGKGRDNRTSDIERARIRVFVIKTELKRLNLLKQPNLKI